MTSEGIFRRRSLPHWDVPDKPVFITACLEGSIPAVGLSRIRHYREELDARQRPDHLSNTDWEHHKHKLAFAFVDKLLDQESPVTHLEDPRQAEIVQNAFLHFADQRYRLLAFVVMPSHHHWVFVPDEEWSAFAVRQTRAQGNERTPREVISHSIQSYTATMCNRVRGEKGAYWQTETFDHWIRDEAELTRVIRYVENNPVSAGFVDCPEAWRWSSARLRKEFRLGPLDPIPNVGQASTLSDESSQASSLSD